MSAAVPAGADATPPASAAGNVGAAGSGAPPPGLRLHGWRDRTVVAVALAAAASGFGQFGVVAALGDVAKGFGQVLPHGATVADQAGLSGTELGVGLAIIRLASIGGLFFAALGDRYGRRRMLLTTIALGLVLTALAALSPGYWWFVAIFACGRPLLSGSNALAQVSASEHTAVSDRAKAVALVAAGYAAGAGLIAVIHGVAISLITFRGLFALALTPLLFLPVLARWLQEPDRFALVAAAEKRPLLVFGAVGPEFRGRLAVVAALTFFVSVISGPATSFVFVYAQNILHLPGVVTAGMVVGGGGAGIGGLLVGRYLADHAGRRLTGALGMVLSAVFAVFAYSGSSGALIVGYMLGVVAGALLAPSLGPFVNELFPTAVRASVSGWLVFAGVLGAVVGLIVFGAVADIDNRFGLSAAVTFLPAACAAALFWRLPETRGRELEESPSP